MIKSIRPFRVSHRKNRRVLGIQRADTKRLCVYDVVNVLVLRKTFEIESGLFIAIAHGPARLKETGPHHHTS